MNKWFHKENAIAVSFQENNDIPYVTQNMIIMPITLIIN